MTAYQLPPFVWPLTVIAVCASAVWRGGNEERLAAGGLLGGWAMTMAAYRFHGHATEWGIFGIDLALLALLVAIALRSARYWPMFAAGFHLLAVFTHVARMLDRLVSGWAYITAEIIWGYLLAFAIGYGALTYRRQPAAKAAPAMADPGATRR